MGFQHLGDVVDSVIGYMSESADDEQESSSHNLFD
jgi:hypothetical protein